MQAYMPILADTQEKIPELPVFINLSGNIDLIINGLGKRMLLYKYRSLENLWFLMDIVANQRVYCANWWELNDPLEGNYEIYLGKNSDKYQSIMESRIEKARESFRIASFSKTATNFLLWSHYADGHKGVAVELEIDEEDPNLHEVTYSPFSSVFTEKSQTTQSMYHLFNGKTEEWEYEEEYRVITKDRYYSFDRPIQRILLGPQVNRDKASLLRKIIPESVELVATELDRVQGVLKVVGPNE